MLFPNRRHRWDFHMAQLQSTDHKQCKPESLQVRKSSKKLTEISFLFRKYHLCVRNSEKVSVSFSGSLTLETAFCLPLFMCFVMTFFSFFSVLRTQIKVQKAMEDTMGDLVVRNVYQTETPIVMKQLSEWYLRGHTNQKLSKMGEIRSVDFTGTEVDLEHGVACLCVNYYVQPVSIGFSVPQIQLKQFSKAKLWTGITVQGVTLDGEDENVYITDTGTVYHLSRSCKYLDIRVTAVQPEAVAELRNSSGGKYYPCDQCDPTGRTAPWYITEHGDRYHGTMDCGSIKRTVRVVTRAEVEGWRLCSRCEKKGAIP